MRKERNFEATGNIETNQLENIEILRIKLRMIKKKNYFFGKC